MFPRGWQDSALFAGALGSLQGQTDGQTSGSPFPWLTALPRPGAAPPRLKSASGQGGEQLRGLGAPGAGLPLAPGGCWGAGGPRSPSPRGSAPGKGFLQPRRSFWDRCRSPPGPPSPPVPSCPHPRRPRSPPARPCPPRGRLPCPGPRWDSAFCYFPGADIN